MKTDGAAGVEVAPPPKVNGLAPVLAAAAGFEAVDPKSKGDAAAVVTTGAAAAAAPKANGEGAAVCPGAAAGVFPKANTLPVEAAFVTEGNAVVVLPAAAPKEKEAVVVWDGATLDPNAGAGWPKTPAAGAFEVTELVPKLKLAFETSTGLAPKDGAWVVVAGAAEPPNWNKEGAADGAGAELAGVAPKENEVAAETVEGTPKAGGAVPVAPNAGVEVATAPKEGAAAVLATAPKVGATVLPATPKG